MRVSWRCNNCGEHPCWQASDFCRAQEDSPGQWVYLPFGIKWDFEGVWNLPTILKICHLGILIILRHLRNSRCRKGAGMPWTQKKTSLSPKTESPCWNGSTKKISCNNLYLPLVPPHIFPDHCSTLTPSGPNLFVLSHPYNLSLTGKLWSLTATSGPHFPSEESHVHVKRLSKFVYFSPVSLSYVSFIFRPVTEPRRVEGIFVSPTVFPIVLKNFYYINISIPKTSEVCMQTVGSGNPDDSEKQQKYKICEYKVVGCWLTDNLIMVWSSVLFLSTYNQVNNKFGLRIWTSHNACLGRFYAYDQTDFSCSKSNWTSSSTIFIKNYKWLRTGLNQN